MFDLIYAAPEPAGTFIDVGAIQSFLLTVIGVLLVTVFGLWVLSRAKSGDASKVVTSSGIAVLGLIFLGGAGVLVLLGDDIVNLIVK